MTMLKLYWQKRSARKVVSCRLYCWHVLSCTDENLVWPKKSSVFVLLNSLILRDSAFMLT